MRLEATDAAGNYKPGGSYLQVFGRAGWERAGKSGAEWKQQLQEFLSQLTAIQSGSVPPAGTNQDIQAKMQQDPASYMGQAVPVGTTETTHVIIKGPGTSQARLGLQSIPGAVQAIQYYLQQTDDVPEDEDAAKEQEKELDDGGDEFEKGDSERQDQVGAPAQFTPHQRENVKEFLVRWGRDKNGNKLDEDNAELRIQRMENTVAQPPMNTLIGKAIAFVMGTRKEMSDRAKQQALDAAGRLAALSNLVKTVELKDGTTALAVRAEDLTSEMETTRRVVTIRGEFGKNGVYLGRGDGEIFEMYKDLQEYTSEVDRSDYGTTFGNLFSKEIGGALFNVRVIPSGATPRNLTQEEFLEFGRLTRASTSVERQGGSTLSSDYRGKMFEDVLELQVAYLSADRTSIKEALDRLKERLENGSTLASADVENLETLLMSDEFEGLLDFRRLDALGVPPEHMLRQVMLQAAAHTEVMLSTFGLNKDNILRAERPSQESSQGASTDVDIFLKPETEIAPAWKHLVVETKEGPVLHVSLKYQGLLGAEVTVSSASLNKSYAPADTATGRAWRIEADRLHGSTMDMLVESGSLTPEQREGCGGAMQADRASWKTLSDTFGRFTEANSSDMTSFLKNQIKTIKHTSTGGLIFFEREATKILKTLKEGSDPQLAAVQLWQLQRMAMAKKSPTYAAGAALNDAIFAGSTFDEEALVRGVPGKLSVGSNHKLMQGLAAAVFQEGKANFTLSRSQIMGKDEGGKDVPLALTRVTAKKTESGRKLIGELRFTRFALERFFDTETSTVKSAKDLEKMQNAGKELEVSTLAALLTALPDTQTGDIKQMGRQLVSLQHPFVLKVKVGGEEFEGGYASKTKALAALDMIHQLASESGEAVSASVEDLDAGRTIS
tara:strand:+ start:13971 stop:16652 length:2682 start_codon:yes stop_codon:yes gene_type:complete